MWQVDDIPGGIQIIYTDEDGNTFRAQTDPNNRSELERIWWVIDAKGEEQRFVQQLHPYQPPPSAETPTVVIAHHPWKLHGRSAALGAVAGFGFSVAATAVAHVAHLW